MTRSADAEGRPYCPIHGVALPPDGSCVLCRKSAEKGSSERTLALAGVIVVVLVFLAGIVYVVVEATSRAVDPEVTTPAPIQVALSPSVEPEPAESVQKASRSPEAESPQMAYQRIRRQVRITMYETPT